MRRNEFRNDPMMKELHRFRANYYKKTEGLSIKEIINLLRKENRQFLSRYGYNLKPTLNGYSLLKKTNAR